MVYLTCAVIGLGGRSVIKAWTELAAGVAARDVSRGGRRRHENLYLEPHDYQIYYVNIDLRHQYGISAAESQTFLRAKRPKRRRARRNGCFRRLSYWLLAPRFFSFVRSLLKEAIIEAVPLPRLSILQFFELNVNNSTLKTEDLYYFGFQLIKHATVL